ncbi:MAG: pyrroline-5-carboxylate reductase [Desulfobacterota bacterium]|nr:pyrroline-5-carboxylate reductase [Thermodesulfobacteriota bacterium]
MELKNLKLGMIGGGAMAENLVRGMVQAQLIPAENIVVSDIKQERLTLLREQFGVKTMLDNVELVIKTDVIILAVKPQNMRLLLEEIRQAVTEHKLIISIAAGIQTKTIAEGLGGKGRIIRCMPNIAAKTLASASALCTGSGATAQDMTLAKKLFDAIGITVVVSEDLMDAVTGLSGSGPAFVFVVIETLADAGVRAGLQRSVALTLAAQTCLGAARLVLTSHEHPAVLKDQVASPGGTTIAGLAALEQAGLRNALLQAVAAAVTRSQELGRS